MAGLNSAMVLDLIDSNNEYQDIIEQAYEIEAVQENAETAERAEYARPRAAVNRVITCGRKNRGRQSFSGADFGAGSDCGIDFDEYMRLFDETVENASHLQDQINQYGGTASPKGANPGNQNTRQQGKANTSTTPQNSATIALIASLRGQLSNSRKRVVELEGQKHQLGGGSDDDNLNTSEDDDRLINQIMILDAQVVDLVENLTTAENKVLELEKKHGDEVADMEDDLHEAEGLIEALRKSLSQDRAVADQAEIDSLDERITKITRELNTAEAALAERTVDLEKSERLCKDLVEQRDISGEQLVEHLQGSTDREDKAEAEINRLNELLAESRDRQAPAPARPSAASRKELTKLRKTIKDLNEEKDLLQANLDGLVGESEQLATITSLRNEVDSLNKELKKANRSRKSRDTKAKNTETKLIRLENTIDQRDATIIRIRGERTAAREERDRLRVRVQAAEAVGGDVDVDTRIQMAVLKARIADLEAKLAAARKAQGHAVDHDCEKAKRKLQNQIAELQEQLKSSQNLLDANGPADGETWQQRVTELEEDIVELNKIIDDLNRQNAQLLTDLNNAKIELFDKIAGAVDHMRDEEIAHAAQERELSLESDTQHVLGTAIPTPPRAAAEPKPSTKRKRKETDTRTNTAASEDALEPKRRATRSTNRTTAPEESSRAKPSKTAAKKRRHR